MLIEEFINIIEFKIFYEGIANLRNCKRVEEISSWKSNHLKKILNI